MGQTCPIEEPGTTGHLRSSVCRLQAPAATGAHDACFQQVQEDMSKAGSVSKEWEAAKEEAIRKVRKQRGEATGTAESELDEKEVKQTFWLSRPDGWASNRKTKRIVLLEYKRTSDKGTTRT